MSSNEREKISQTIERYYSDLKFRLNIFDSVKKEMNVYMANDFNVFNYINPNENKLSDIIADLLNPNGKHGQGEAFLKEFIYIIGKELNYNLLNSKVVREDTTSYLVNCQRRIDITINIENGYKIGIENKPWDMEQENQLQDYIEHLSKKHGDNFCIVYLSGDGSEPLSISDKTKEKCIKEKKLFILSYEVELKKWLQNCYKESKSEKIRIFISDFIKYIENNFRNLYSEMED